MIHKYKTNFIVAICNKSNDATKNNDFRKCVIIEKFLKTGVWEQQSYLQHLRV